MSILQYELVAPITNRKKPHIDNRGAFIIPDIQKLYTHYIEVKRYNPKQLCYEYFLLLGTTKFDEQCRTCRVDNYGRLKLIPHGDIKEYITNEIKSRGNINVEYLFSEESYDIWKLI